jgi:hypothetical protein
MHSANEVPQYGKMNKSMDRYKTSPSSSLRPYMSVEGRQLSGSELRFVETGYWLSLYVSFLCPSLTKKDDKWRDAFRQVVKTTPILQTVIVGEAPEAIFAAVDQHKWPNIEIHHVESDDDEYKGAMATARTLIQEEKNYFRTRGPEATSNIPVRVHAVLGPARVAVGVAAPHCFMDGVAISTVFLKTVLYVRFPKILWTLLDRLSDTEVPTFYEMILKKDIGILDQFSSDGSAGDGRDDLHAMTDSRPGLDPSNFRFETYDMASPQAIDMLNGFVGDIGAFSAVQIKKCTSALRKQGVTLTPAFAALSVNTLAIILEKRNLNAHEKPLVSFVGSDGRRRGKWGDQRDKKVRLPVVADYAYSYETQIPMKQALRGGISVVARTIKDNMNALDSDLKTRAQNMTKLGYNSSGMLLGVSSFIAPSFAMRTFKDKQLDGRIDFGAMPRIWFYVFTANKVKTKIKVDIMLPIRGLTEAEVKNAIKKAVSDSPLQMLFENAI